MKVLQINSVCGLGSTGRIATDIHQILLEQGHESYIAYGRELPINCDNTIKIGTKFDNYIHVGKTRLFDAHGFSSKEATRDFIEKIKELNPDIIHLHNIHGYYLNVEVLFEFLKEFDKPIVWTLHDCWAFTGHCAYFDYSNCNKWMTGCYDCPEKKSYPQSLIIDNSKKNYQNKRMIFTGIKRMNIVTPSYWLAELVKTSFLGDYAISIINNGIDLSVFQPTTSSEFRLHHGLSKKFIILGIASEWDRRKGLKYFHDLSKIISADMIIVLVGLNKQQIERLPEGIIGISRTNNINELVEIYSEADVFVNPTLEDNFPTTNLEALACGTPVITFRTGGSPEIVSDKTGIVVKKGNLEELFSAIKEVQKNGKQYYSNSAIKRGNHYYNKKEKFLEYIELYESVIEKNKSEI